MQLKRILRLFALSATMDAAWLMRDTKMCLLTIFSDLLSNISSIAGVFLLSVQFGGVGNMSAYDVLFMLGYVTTLTGVFLLFFTANNGHISRIIGRGQLDHLIMQPLPIWVQLLTCGFIPVSGSSNLLAGIGIMAYALHKLGIPITPAFVGLVFLQVTSSITLLLAASYWIGSSAFWWPVACEEICTDVIDGTASIANYPLSGMAPSLQMALVTILPTGLLGWFPACALLGKAPLDLPFFFTSIIAGGLCVLAAAAFRKGWKHYGKVGSYRYKPHGFR